jgi:Cu(I)/Ag(I) efflux system membrane fusion protein
MELVLRSADELTRVIKPVNESVLTSVKTARVKDTAFRCVLETQGFTDYDNRYRHDLSSPYSGRIERLYVKSLFQQVARGELLFEIYSPEIQTAEQNLLFVMENEPGNSETIEQSKDKLRLLGLPDASIAKLIKTGKLAPYLPVYSPCDGITHNIGASQEGMSQGMENESLNLREGQYVVREQNLFSLVDHSRIAVSLQVKPDEISRIRVGQELSLTVPGGDELKGKIDFIEPAFRKGMNTLIARVYLPNMAHVHANALVNARIDCGEVEGLWIPASAVMDLGRNKIVWAKKDLAFVMQKIETGVEINGFVEVLDGLTKKSEFAVEAHYLTDSEAFIKLKGTNDE